MLKRIKTENPNDYFIDLSKRKDRGVYFCRINGYNENIHEFIKKYYEAARLSGVIIFSLNGRRTGGCFLVFNS